MTAIDLIATSLNRRDDIPNQALAAEIIQSKRDDWVKELAGNLQHKDKNIGSDCIKVLYEVGERGAAEMIAPYCHDFGQLLKSKNNRLVWGAMAALDSITPIKPKEVYDLLPAILDAVDTGSVITIDHGVGVLSKLAGMGDFSATAFPLLTGQLKKCPPKQFPMYAEKAVGAALRENKRELAALIESRMQEMERESQRARLKKILKKLKSGE